MQRIVCAANKNTRTGEIILGIRHWDTWMRSQCDMSELGWRACEQGFVDQFGTFLTRTEAWVVAKGADQIFRRVGGDEANGGTLYSENLY